MTTPAAKIIHARITPAVADCDAVAECGEFASEKGKKCPLNACCSEFGFCGTTKDFCNAQCQSNCDSPSLPDGRSSSPVRDKVIVYYEAWSARRKCKPFQPYNIPTGGVTHVNFAFAYIDPKSFEVTTMDSATPEHLFQDATAIKSMKSGLDVSLEVFVSIGGWTFSNDGTPTQPVFGDIASNQENRQKFADNLVKFMTLYGFDGVDLDWEYPVAPDRGGRKQDKENFVKLMRTLRKTFDASPRGGYGLTFTIPSSYWYLQHFDVPSLLDAGASWVNLMSYDLHGVWDQNNPIGSIVQGHSNLTEIKESVELLWRNNVPPGKNVLGTGFYGRSFTLEDPSCDVPGFTFSGAANKGDCTDEGGILGFFEIQEILKNGNDIKKVHDKEAAVKYFRFDTDQWVSYDDAETFDQKVEWADSIGLGGLMSWAIDLDDNHFTALSGLIGKDAGQGLDKALALKEKQSASWSSENETCAVRETEPQENVLGVAERRAAPAELATARVTMIALSGYGSSSSLCGVAGRKKSLCCDAPDRVEPFTPVPLENIFPVVPPVTNPAKWDLQLLGGISGIGSGSLDGTNTLKDPNYGPFGFISIAGPTDVVSSFSKRDESHIEVVDCSSITSAGTQTVQIYCTVEGEDSNCDQVLEGGVEGTVVRMPDNCGPGQYVVAHSLKPSASQTLPPHLAKRVAPGRPVMELEFSYDFGLMKRADDPIYLRIDYSNQPGYWDNIVDSPGEKRKRSVHPRDISQRDLDKRFFSEDSASWGRRFDKIDDGDYYTDFSRPADEPIINSQVQKCDDEFLELTSSGECETHAKFGFTMIGTIQPFSIDQSYGFIDLSYDLDTYVKITGDVGVETEYRHHAAHIVPESSHGFSHPGIVSFKPTFDIDIGISADNASFSGDTTIHFRSGTDKSVNKGYVRETFPFSAGGERGGIRSYTVDDAFDGHLNVRHSEVQLSLIPNFNMQIDVDHSLTSSLSKRDGSDLLRREDIIGGSGHSIGYDASFSGLNRLVWNPKGVNLQVDSLLKTFTSSGETRIGDWTSSETIGEAIGDQPGASRLHSQGSRESSKSPRFGRKVTPRTIFRSDVLTCTQDETDIPLCRRVNFCEDGSIPCEEEATATRPRSVSRIKRHNAHLKHHIRQNPHRDHDEGVADGVQDHEILAVSANNTNLTQELRVSPLESAILEKRKPFRASGNVRDDFKTDCRNRETGLGNALRYQNFRYPACGDWEPTDEIYDKAYNVRTLDSCTDGEVTGHVVPEDAVKGEDPEYCTEHIVELQTMQMFITSVYSRMLPDKTRYELPPIYCDFIAKAFNSKTSQKFLPEDVPQRDKESASRSPIDRILVAQGTFHNWEVLVLLEQQLNGFKKSLWEHKQPRAKTKTRRENRDVNLASKARKNTRHVINVFAYLNVPDVHSKMVKVLNDMRAEIVLAEQTWVTDSDPSHTSTGIVKHWDVWLENHFATMVNEGKAFVLDNVGELNAFWLGQPESSQREEVLKDCKALGEQIILVKIDRSGINGQT
ncbi:glycoside hydrolase [Hortaea werneckii]|nr:glycoside hydrolase [Hortaea werneckii]